MADLSLVLNPEETRALEEEHVFLSGPSNGKRKISAAFLSPSSYQGSISSVASSSSSEITASVRIRKVDLSIKTPVDLPENDESIAFLEWLGFTRKKAGDIFARWASRPLPNPDCLFDYVVADLSRLNFQPLVDQPETQAMLGLGIADELQQKLLNPRFSQLLNSQTLQSWLEDTMRIRFAALEQILQRLKSCAVRIIANRKEKKRPKVPGAFEQGSYSSNPIALAPSYTALTSIKQDDWPSTCIAVDSPPPALPDHYLFYKAQSLHDIDEMFIREDGSVNMGMLQTYKGGDFNEIQGACYWTVEPATAEQYRLWTAARCPWADTWIIQIQIPNSFIDGLRTSYLYFQPKWKEYTWYCRKGTSAGDPPARFDEYWKPGQAQLVVGHILGRSPQKIPRIRKEDIHEKITEDDVMVINRKKATQLGFMDYDVVKRIGELIRGKIYIEVTPAE